MAALFAPLAVSGLRLGLGGAPLGNLFSALGEPQAQAVLDAAWESGCRSFDTAPHYGHGLSEHRIGQVLRRKPRESFTLSSKVGRLLRADPGAPYPHVVHRLDKDTSGVLLFARHAAAQGELRRQFRERTVEKRYLALVAGVPSPPEGRSEIAIEKDPARPGRMRLARRGGKLCRTEYRTLSVHGTHAWVELRPLTGRTHQIRITMRELGAPCVADPLYGDGEPLWLSPADSTCCTPSATA